MSSFLLHAQNAIIFHTGSTFIYVQNRKFLGKAVYLGALAVLKMYNTF